MSRNDEYKGIVEISNKLRKIIDNIKKNNKIIESSIDQVSKVFNTEDEKILTENVKNASINVTNLLNDAKILITEMKNLKINDMKLIQNNLPIMICDLAKQTNILKNKYTIQINEKLIRRGKIIMPDIPDEKIKEIIETNPNAIPEFLNFAINVPADEAQLAYQDAVSKSKDVDILLRSIKELNEMMNDFAFLISEQSENIDKIELTIEIAGNNIRHGNNELKKANELQKKTRKCYCCICIVVIIIIIIIIGVTIPTLNSIKHF
jgi:t-SNARE complex subunit (syntaxin)